MKKKKTVTESRFCPLFQIKPLLQAIHQEKRKSQAFCLNTNTPSMQGNEEPALAFKVLWDVTQRQCETKDLFSDLWWSTCLTKNLQFCNCGCIWWKDRRPYIQGVVTGTIGSWDLMYTNSSQLGLGAQKEFEEEKWSGQLLPFRRARKKKAKKQTSAMILARRNTVK